MRPQALPELVIADHPELLDLVQRAADLPARERAEFVDTHCGGDAALKRRLLDMLGRLDAGTPPILSPPAVDFDEPALDLAPGTMLGDYKILDKIGEGGFGVIHVAEQRHPVRRRVAIKLLKAGMDTKQVLARFETERNALALMNHPGISRVLDAGATETGRPYFVMEYVEGDPITAFCDRQNLSIEERLELFTQVCAAVQHAHQHGIIHRDLKPSNILVAMDEGRPIPKVIDFGIAKALHQPLTDMTVFTHQGQLVGTPEYMSPEQAEMSGVGVDTTTDVYSLGVVLYELLTGALPFDAVRLRSQGLAEIHRILREEEPARPSTRISTVDANTTVVSRLRRTAPRVLSRVLRGDLDWVVMKAMEKPRVRRYASASELAADVRRYLAKEPVVAGPPSAAYRMRKFVDRNRVAVGFLVTVFLLLITGIVGTTWGMLEADHGRDAADTAKNKAVVAKAEADIARAAAVAAKVEADARRTEAEDARGLAEDEIERANSERARARAVTDFLLDTLGLADPDVTQLPVMTMADALDAAAAEVGVAFADYPESEAEVQEVLGLAYETLGRPDKAAIHLRRALKLYDTELEPDDLARLGLLDSLQSAMRATTSMEWAAWMKEAQRTALAIVEARFPVVHTDVIALNNLAFRRASPASFIASFDEAVRRAEARLGPDDPAWSAVTYCLVFSASWMSWHRPDPTIVGLYERACALRLERAPETRSASRRRLTKEILDAKIRAEDYAGARQLATESIDRLSDVLGEDHWHLEIYRSAVGQCLVAERRFEEAEPLLRRGLEALDRSEAPNLLDAASTRSALARVCDSTGRPDEADAFRQINVQLALKWDGVSAWVSIKRGYPVDDPLVVAVDEFDLIVDEANDTGVSPATRAEDLERVAREIVSQRRRFRADSDRALILVPQLMSRGSQSFSAGAHGAGLTLLRDAAAVSRAHSNALPGMRCQTLLQLSVALSTIGEPEAAESAARESLAIATANRAELAAKGYGSFEVAARAALGAANGAPKVP